VSLVVREAESSQQTKDEGPTEVAKPSSLPPRQPMRTGNQPLVPAPIPPAAQLQGMVRIFAASEIDCRQGIIRPKVEFTPADEQVAVCIDVHPSLIGQSFDISCVSASSEHRSFYRNERYRFVGTSFRTSIPIESFLHCAGPGQYTIKVMIGETVLASCSVLISTQQISIPESSTLEQVDPHYKLGCAHSEKGEYDLAIEEYTLSISITPTPAAYNNRGLAYHQKRMLEQAIQDFTNTIQMNPNDPRAYINRALAYTDQGDHNRAIEDYTNALRINPNYAEAYCSRGNAYDAEGKYDLAIEDYTKAIAMKPQMADGYYNRARVYQKKGLNDSSIEDYTAALSINPNFAEAYGNRGHVYFLKRDYDRAMQDANKAIQINPNYPYGYYTQGLVYGATRDFHKAIADFTEVIRLAPNEVRAYYFRGGSYAMIGQLDNAIADLTEAIRLDPTTVDTYGNRACAYSQKGEYDKAIADFDKAIQMDHGNTLAYNGLAWLLATCPDAKYRDGRKAVGNATRACELSQWVNPNCLGTLAAAYAETGEFEQAIKWQEKALEVSTPDYDKTAAQSRLELYKAGKPYRDSH
jgi:tetratricopeptide (TPR) repeat protein